MTDSIDRLVAGYHRIDRERMRGLPIYNAALQVEAVGFRPHGRCLCGVLITPWFMNLVLLPVVGEQWSASTFGEKVIWQFNAGEYEFTRAVLEDLGTHLSTPLFSTVQDFPDQDTARQVAEAVLEQLSQAGTQTVSHDPLAAALAQSGFNRPVSRRKLLRGWMSAGQDY
ncbi:MAG: [NiFe]-hydrogenase assembly chaperone HybE [Gammaproteobacteria bacterium]